MMATVVAMGFGFVVGVAVGVAGLAHVLKWDAPDENVEFIEVRRIQQ